MKIFGERISHFLKDDDGQAVIEYILILSFVISISLLLFRAIMAGLNRGVAGLATRMESSLKTGTLPNEYWGNVTR